MPSSLVKTVVFVLLASIGSFLFGLLNDLDVFKPLPAPSLGGETRGGTTTTTTPPGFVCRTLARETAIGAEDIITITPSILLAGTDDRLRLWENARFGPAKTPQGGLLAIYDDEEEERKEGGKKGEEGITIEPVPLVNFPEGIAFHPHGMYYHRETSKLFVINHAYEKGGERIDVFHLPFTTITSSRSRSSRRMRLVHARWLYVLAPPIFQAECMGTLNDLVVLHSLPAAAAGGKEGGREPRREDELYVTHYRAFPDAAAGRLVPGNILAGVHDLLNFFSIVSRRRWTRVLYCKGNVCRPTEINGKQGGGVLFNGINVSPDRKRLLVADMKSVQVLEIDPSLPLSLHRLAHLPTPHLVDNIEGIRSETEGGREGGGEELESYTLGSCGHLWMFLRHNLHYAGQAHGDRAMVYNITGGVQRLQREGGTEGEYVVKEVLLQDGSGLSGVSGAAMLSRFSSSSEGGERRERYVMGSWSDRGIMVCEKQEMKEMKEEEEEDGGVQEGEGKEEL
ncbi:Hypothetical protein NocV09_03500030 [Nannochloropsis oceanica]